MPTAAEVRWVTSATLVTQPSRAARVERLADSDPAVCAIRSLGDLCWVAAMVDHDLPTGLDGLHVLGEYWHQDRSTRTELGERVRAAKDGHNAAAAQELATSIVGLVPGRLDLLAGTVLVGAVPSFPVPTVRLSHVLAKALAEAGAGEWRYDLIGRSVRTPRLRDVEPSERPGLAKAAGYSISTVEPGTTVVLVDDVVLTGTTLSHVAGCLRSAGAASVIGVVAARSRRR